MLKCKKVLMRSRALVLWCVLSGVLCSIVASCSTSTNEDAIAAKEYIYVSHPRLDRNDSIYRPVYDIDFSQYEVRLLGGDLTQSSFSNDTIIAHLDGLFDFKSPTTLWSPGNHDKTSDQKFERITGKQKYHRHIQDDVTFITLDSQDSLSSIVGAQKDFLLHTLDSIDTPTVVIMTHKLIFMNDHPVMDSQIATICNANKGACYHCHNPNNFYEVVYPKLEQLASQNVQVIWVGGDLGYKTSEFEYIDDQGIIFLGNGLWYKKDWNKVLLLSKPLEEKLSYRFVYIDTLLKNQQKLRKS